MKNFFRLLVLVLVLVVGTTTAQSVDINKSIDNIVVIIPQNVNVGATSFISNWVGDNFSGEGSEDALMPGQSFLLTFDQKAGAFLFRGDEIPFDLVFSIKGKTIKVFVLASDGSISTNEKHLAHAIIISFKKDFTNWLIMMADE